MLQCRSWQPRVCISTALAEVKYLIEHPFLLHWSQLLLKFNLSWSCLPHTQPIPTPCEGWNLKAVFALFFISHLSVSLLIFLCLFWEMRTQIFNEWQAFKRMPLHAQLFTVNRLLASVVFIFKKCSSMKDLFITYLYFLVLFIFTKLKGTVH